MRSEFEALADVPKKTCMMWRNFIVRRCLYSLAGVRKRVVYLPFFIAKVAYIDLKQYFCMYIMNVE